MRKEFVAVCFLCVGLVVMPAWGQPREWVDDFMDMATYNSAAFLGPCYGATVSTKYTTMEAILGDFLNQQALSGDGMLKFSSRISFQNAWGIKEAAIIGVMNFNQGCPDVAGVPFKQGSEPFTSDDVCAYWAVTFSTWQTRFPPVNQWFITGPDGQPGVANVDDDLNGTTDNFRESPAARPTTVGNGYGNRDGTGFQAGQDGAPGIAGVDDDGNGTTDDVGETGPVDGSGVPLSDDGDDVQRQMWWMILNANLGTSTTLVYVDLDAGASKDAFSLRLIKDLQTFPLDLTNEITPYNYFQPDVKYNCMFCASGDCYGALLWTEDDMANPDEVLGPSVTTLCSGPDSNIAGLGFDTFGGYTFPYDTPRHYKRHMRVQGNSNFSNTFWVISGNPQVYPQFPSVSADLDGDRDVDGNDFLTFSLCYNGSLKAPQSGCANLDADMDHDGDVDGFDFTTWSLCHNGSLKHPQASCMPPYLTNCP